jgi:hypothetical protein
MIAGDRDQRRQEVEKQPGNSQRHENYNAVIPAVASSVLPVIARRTLSFFNSQGQTRIMPAGKSNQSVLLKPATGARWRAPVAKYRTPNRHKPRKAADFRGMSVAEASYPPHEW